METTDRKMALVAFYFFVLSLGVSAVDQVSAKDAICPELTRTENFVGKTRRNYCHRCFYDGLVILDTDDREDPWMDGRILGDPSQAVDGAQTLSELLKESPWALVAFKEFKPKLISTEFPEMRRRQSATFTPRLGQTSSEIADEDFEEDWSGRNPERRGTPPFAPRLGRRNGLPFQPRMGRRHSRGNSGGEEATNSHTSSERHYLFSPRLGRGSPTPAEGATKEA